MYNLIKGNILYINVDVVLNYIHTRRRSTQLLFT